jgi:hypothetical protein
MSNPNWIGRPEKNYANALPGQMELATVIAHKRASVLRDVNVTASNSTMHIDTHKPAGVRLAKMLSQYDDQPSSQLWGDIQRLAREILK